MSFDIIKSLTNEFTHESENTRKLLARIPLENGNWTPHEKSMTLQRLAAHVADIPNWVAMTIEQEELDFATTPYTSPKADTVEELLTMHDNAVAAALKAIASTNAEDLKNKKWTMRQCEHIILSMPKIAVLRSFAFNHLYHHRGQLTVYLRMLNIPLPALYGPSADEQ